jgi:signal peptidase I
LTKRGGIDWSILLTLAVLLPWWVLLRPTFLGGDTSYIVVAGHSMEPTYYTGDLTVLHRQSAYIVGEVIAFKANGGEVIHRIKAGTSATGFVTQGDNNPEPDMWRPKADEVVGKVWLHVPKIGVFLAAVRQPQAVAVLVGVLLTLALIPQLVEDDVRHQTRRQRLLRRRARS